MRLIRKQFIHCNGHVEKVIIDLFKQYSQTWQMKRELDFYEIYFLSIKTTTAIPIEEVESVDSIVRRFKTGAMSFGSFSQGST